MDALHLPQDPELVARYPTLVESLEAHGYGGMWVGEVNGADAASAAAVAATQTTTADIGVLLNVFTRSPTVLAMTAWTIGLLAPGRAHIVLGVASPLLVERWNGIEYRRVHDRLADSLRFIRAALAGDRVQQDFATFSSANFALPPVDRPAKLLLAACGPRALSLAATEADGVVLNWVSPDDVARIDPLPAERTQVSIVVPVCATADREVMERVMRPVVADYLCAPAYAHQQVQLGRGDGLSQMWDAWARGDRMGARAAIPSAVLDELVVWGDPRSCREQVTEAGRMTEARTISTFFLPPGMPFEQAAAIG